jgi:hypothetical protein
MDLNNFTDFLIASSFGAMIGAGELVSRYRDEPGRALTTLPAILYLAINAGASGAALWLIREVGLVKTPKIEESSSRWAQVFMAGFGAMVVFRSSIFTARSDGRDVAIGPAHFLQAFLRAIDQAVDRRRGLARDEVVGRVMKDVSFDKAYKVLTAHCLGLLNNTTKEDQAELGRMVDSIRKSDMPQSAKSRLLGLALLNVVGQELLIRAVLTCRVEISVDQPGSE